MKYRCDYCEDIIQYEVMRIELPKGEYVYFCDDVCFSGWLEEHLSYERVDEDD